MSSAVHRATSPALKVLPPLGSCVVRRLKSFNLASLTILILDYLLTLDLEVELIWKSRWNTAKVLFLLTRYLPFIDTAVVLSYQFTPILTAKQCAIIYEYSAWMFVVGMSIAELLLTLRTWAVWEKDRRLTFGLPVFFISFWVTEYVVMGLYLEGLHHEPSPVQPWMTCTILDTNRRLSGCWIVLMLYDAGILLLIVIQALRTFRSWGDVPLTRVIYQDGIIYFAYLFCLSFLNVVIILRLPDDYINLLSLMERIVHSLLTCRIILHIRQQSAENSIQHVEEMDLKDIISV